MALFVGAPHRVVPLTTSNASPAVRKGHLAFLCVAGPLDDPHSEFLLERGKVLARTCRCVVVGLERCPHADSAGLQAVKSLAATLAEAEVELRLVVAPGSRLEDDLAQLALENGFHCYPTLGAALSVPGAETH